MPIRQLLHSASELPKDRATRLGILILNLLLVALIGLVDARTGYSFGLSVFYVLPIGFVTVAIGRVSGVAVAIISAGIWFGVSLSASRPDLPPLIPYWNALIRLAFFMIIILTLDAWAHEWAHARRDSLTGVANRHAFFELLEREMDRARRTGRPLTVAYLDCDRFKQINDRLGHRAGDAVLCAVADVLQRTVRKTDLVARLGGDEFAIILPETGATPVRQIFQRVQRAIADVMQRKEWPVTVSIGAATFVGPPKSVDEVVEAADQLMYAVKIGGMQSKFEQQVFGR